jgi:DNA polymerase III subunit alpha
MRKTVNAPDLHCHSTFSILDGMGSPEAVVKRAVELGWGAACLTEHGWMGSVPAFYKACRKHRINPILGCEMYVVPHEALGVHDKDLRSISTHLTVLALSKEGYQNLVAWNTLSMQRENFYHRPRISLEAMVDSAPWALHHNVILSGCLGSELSQLLLNSNGTALQLAQVYVEAMRTVFPNFYIEVQDHRIDKFVGRGFKAYEELLDNEAKTRAALFDVAEATDTPLVVTNDSHYQRSEQRKAHVAMMASKMNRWGKEDTHYGQSQEHVVKAYVKDYAYWANYMRSLEGVVDHGRIPQSALRGVQSIAAEADVRLDPLDDFTYSIPFSGYSDPVDKIRRRARKRLRDLLERHGALARHRFEHELEAMGEFAHYLLFMSDFIRHARSQGILTNTRGSAANSIVCYCLEIHDIDSIEYKLTFERFVNPERKKLPDIDIDIEADRYQDFMEYVKQYMGEREGEGQCVQIGNYGTLANRSTFRTVAEALGIDKETQDEIALLLPQMIDSGLVDENDDAYAILKEQFPEVHDLAMGIFDAIKNVSQHACGWLLGTHNRPIAEWVPLYLIASSNTLVTQYDLKGLEAWGLTKGDFLRLKMLAVVKRALTMAGMDALDLQQIPLDDPKTFEMIRAGRTEGVFTLQGKTNRQGVMEVEAETVHDVIAAVAIYRPAITRPGYHRVYNARRRGEEVVEYPHAIAEDILGETYGLPIFQEQILELTKAIGFSDAESQDYLDAIKLAKGVGRYAAEAFDKLHDPFIERASEKMAEEEAEGVWQLIDSFRGYGFNRGHATSYGILAVRSAYLRCHHPQAYFTALLDVFPEKGRYIAAARNEGFRILPPDVNLSTAGFSRGEDKRSIRCGLAGVKGLGPVAVNAIIKGQPYNSLDDLRERTPTSAVKSTTLDALSAVGALYCLGVKHEVDDASEFALLGFTLDEPEALKGIEPEYVKARNNERWRHLGYSRGVDYTEPRASVSKLFWIPPLPKADLLKLKTSPWARVKTWLLTAVDVNGIAFTIMADEKKKEVADYLKFIAKAHRGNAICMDGAVRQPFDTDGPLGFRLYDVTGTLQGDPQVFGSDDDKTVRAFNVLHQRKRAARKEAA